MSKTMGIIIGITVFILIMCCTYTQYFVIGNSEETSSDEGIKEIEQGELIYKGQFPMPIENFIEVTSKFGYRDAHGVVSANHTGIDLCGNLGSRILAVQDGEVTHAGWQGGYGNCVEIKHTNEQGESFYTFYAHMRDNSICVENGQTVTTGQVIGVQGSTGNSTGDHLHFEIRTNTGSNKYAIDPAPYLFTEKESE